MLCSTRVDLLGAALHSNMHLHANIASRLISLLPIAELAQVELIQLQENLKCIPALSS